MTSHLRLALVLVATVHSIALADTWGPPQGEHWSRNGSYVLLLGGSDGLELRRAGNKGSKPIWSRGFVNGRRPPYRAFVADDGRHAVLVDAHGSLGYDEALVFLGTQGEVLRSYELDQMLTAKEILNASLSVSSIHWSRHGWFALRDGDRQFAFITQKGTVRLYETATGQRLPLTNALRSQIVSEAIVDARLMLGANDDAEQIRGAVLLGILDAKVAVGKLRELLPVPSPTAPAGRKGSGGSPYVAVQAAAACALLQITGRDAFDLIQQRLATLPPEALPQFLEALSNFDRDGYELGDPARVAIATEFWEPLTSHPAEKIRAVAQAQRLERDDGPFLRAHLDLLKSKNQRIRYHAYVCLSQHALPAEVPLLRAGLADSDDTNRLWAWRGLVRLQPPDTEAILKQGMAAKNSYIRFESLLALARWGDVAAKQQVLARISKMKDHSHESAGSAIGEFEAEDLCVLVAEIKLEAARAPLREALRNPCRDIQQAACGALAALGDNEALSKLREFAREGHALDRADAIRWLDRVHDYDSDGLLRRAADDDEPWVREAAVKVLANAKVHIQGRPASREGS